MTPFDIIKSWMVKVFIFKTDFDGSVINVDGVINVDNLGWNVIAYAVVTVMINLAVRAVKNIVGNDMVYSVLVIFNERTETRFI